MKKIFCLLAFTFISSTNFAYAGSGIGGYSGDDGLATSAKMNAPTGVCLDNSNNVIIVDAYNNVLRKVSVPVQIGRTCNSAINIDNNNCTPVTLSAPVNDIWFSFTADSTAEIVSIIGNINMAQIDSITFYKGSCSNLTPIYSPTLALSDSQRVTNLFTNLIKGNTYYIKVTYNTSISSTAQIRICKTLPTSNSLGCGTTACIIINQTFNYIPYTAHYDDAFNYGSVPCWKATWGSPQVISGTAYMWAVYSNNSCGGISNSGESIYSDLPGALSIGKTYVLQYDYATVSGQTLDNVNVYLAPKSQNNWPPFSAPAIKPINQGIPIDQITGITNPAMNTRVICFTVPNNNLDQIIFYPEANSSSACIHEDLYLDNVMLFEINSAIPSPAPICSGGSTPIGLNCSLPNIVYSWSPTVGLSCSTCPSPIAYPTQTTVYTLTMNVMQGSTVLCSVSQNITVTVLPNPLNPILSISPNPVCEGQPVCFTASSLPSSGTYIFHSGVGSFVTGNLPISSLPCQAFNPGTYNPSFSISSDGCKKTVNGPAVLVNPIQATIGYTVTCEVVYLSANNVSCAGTGGSTSYQWSVFQGSTVILYGINGATPPPFTLPAGTYTIILFLYNQWGAVETFTTTITVGAVTCCTNIPPPQTISTTNLYPRTSISWPSGTTSISTSYTNKDFTGMSGANVIINSPTTNGTTLNITFTNCTFLMYPGSKIVIHNNTTSGTSHQYVFNVSFINCHLRGCAQLWEGISFSHSSLVGEGTTNYTTNLNITNTLLEDAWIGIDNSNSIAPAIKIDNSMFNNNNIDLNLDQFHLDPTSYSHKTAYSSRKVFLPLTYNPPFLPLPVFSNAANYYSTILNPLSVGSVKPSLGLPHNFSGTTLSTFGTILFSSPSSIVADIQRFDLSSASNIFDRHLYGIYGKDINLNIGKQHFFNIPFTGILSDGFQSGNGGAPSLNLGYSPASANNFTNCGNGIYTRYKTDFLYASYNIFYGCNNAIFVRDFNTASSANNCIITNNTIKNLNGNGIQFFLNGAINALVQNNQIFYPSSTARNFTSKGIVVNEATRNNVYAQYTIDQNNIDYTYTGIECTETNSAQITNNTIQTNTPPNFPGAGIYNYGITNVNCYNNAIGNNTITGDNIQYHYWEYGINSADHPAQNIFCNSITGINTGLNLQGYSPTMPNLPIRNNDLNENLLDVWMLNSCVLGWQDYSFTILGNTFYFPVDNTFKHTTGYLYNSFCSNQTQGISSPFYIQNAGNFRMPQNDWDQINPGSKMTPVFVSGGFPNPCNTTCPGCDRLVNLARKVALDSLFAPTALRSIFVSRQKLFANLMAENINTTGNAALTNFKNTQAAGNIGTFFTIDKNIAGAITQNNPALLTMAAQANTSLAPTDSMQLLLKLVTGAYIDYLNNGYKFTAGNLVTLKQIAPLCPFVYGTAVWQARSMLADSLQYTNTCQIQTPPTDTGNVNNTGDGNRLAHVQSSEITNQNSISVFPNPNKGLFTVVYNLSNEKTDAAFVLYDALGNEVASYILKTDEKQLNIAESILPQGFYMYKITVGGKILQNGRLAIVK